MRVFIALAAAAVAVFAVVMCLRNMPVEEAVVAPVVVEEPEKFNTQFGDTEEFAVPEVEEVPVVE